MRLAGDSRGGAEEWRRGRQIEQKETKATKKTDAKIE
jgi:hypothetical protein